MSVLWPHILSLIFFQSAYYHLNNFSELVNTCPKNSVAIFCGAGLEVFGLLNVPKNLKIRFF